MGVTPEEAEKLTYDQKEQVDMLHFKLGQQFANSYNPRTGSAIGEISGLSIGLKRLDVKVEREVKRRIESDGWKITKFKFHDPFFAGSSPHEKGDYTVRVKKS
jgi:hypothetical protein